ncbi:membrane protein [Helicobacter pylori]
MWVGSSISLLLGALLGVRSFIADWGGGVTLNK